MDVQRSETPKDDWDGILSKCLMDLKEKYSRLSEVQLAQKINIPRATLNRLFNGDRKRPRLSTFVKVIVGSGNGSLLKEAIHSFDDEFSNALKNLVEIGLTDKNAGHSTPDLEEYLKDPDTFVAYMLASLEFGTTRKQVIDVLGNSGIDILNILIKDGFAKEENGRVHLVKKMALIRSFDDAKKHLSTYAKHYKVSHVGKDRNYLHSLMDGVNSQGVKEIQNAHREFHAKMKSILTNNKFKGEIPAFSVAFCDTLTSMEMDNEKGGLQ